MSCNYCGRPLNNHHYTCPSTTTINPDCVKDPCEELIYSDCVFYSGPDNECYGIMNGDNINDVLAYLIDQLAPYCITTTTTEVPTTTTTTEIPTTTTTTTTTTSTTTSTTTTTTTARPLQIMTINAFNLRALSFSSFNSLTDDVIIDWGDGLSDTYPVGSSNPSHSYPIGAYTGLITIKSVDLTTITDFNLVTTTPISTPPYYPVSIFTSELIKLDGLITMYLGAHIYLDGITSELPRSLQTAIIISTNLSGNTSELPLGMINLQVYGANTISGDTRDLPRTLTTLYIFGSNQISGLLEDLPPGLINIDIEGVNTINGDLFGLPTGLVSFTLLGNNYINGNVNLITSYTALTRFVVYGVNTLSGDVVDLPPNLINIQIDGANTLSGDIADLPSSLTYVYIDGVNTIGGLTSGFALSGVTTFVIAGQNTISGDISYLGSVSQQLGISGNYSSISGNLIDTARTLVYLNIEGNNTLAGLVSDLPPNVINCTISGINTISGDIAIDLPISLTYIALESVGASSLIYTHTVAHPWASNMRKVSFTQPIAFTTTEIDNILIDLAASTTSWSSDKTINLSGVRSTASDAAVSTLTGLGVTITFV